MNLLFETTLWLLIIFVFVTVHFVIIERHNKSPRHFISWLVCFISACVISQVVYDELTLQIINVIYLGLLYWILFPLLLNTFRKKELLYIGNDEFKWEGNDRYGKVVLQENGSWLDALERSIGSPAFTLGLKIIICALSLVCLTLI